MDILKLNGNWYGECIGDNGEKRFDFSGTVPGCVHTDLSGKHIPEDIFYRANADKCQWIENCNWHYTKTFNIESIPPKARLVFEGLDTYADIYLNNKYIGSADNMFIPHPFDVRGLLKSGENVLSVHFRSPVKEVEGLEDREGAFTRERMHTRRIQCTYGWDWVARFVTCGIWRDVYLDFTDDFALKNAYIYTEHILDVSAQIVIEAEFLNYQSGKAIEIEVLDPHGITVYSHRKFCKEQFIKEYIDIPYPCLWYPAGYGDQPLYTLKICGKELSFGIRTATILQLPDEPGSPYYQKCLEIKDSVSGKIYDHNENFSGFQLLINDIPIMCKGANWVPCEPFPSAETDEKITELLLLAKDAGLNTLRVWGGGIFEKKHFYDECDRLGILVTQDLLMACGHYPEEKPDFITQLQKEAEFAAYELRNHPSLVWWSGDNENAVWGSDDATDYRGRTAIHQGIMPVLSRLDPKRRFMLSSPCGGNTFASKTVGTTHNTQYLWDSIFPYILDTDMADYKEFFNTLLARFIAEEPTLGAISLPSLRRFTTEDDIFNSDEMWRYHTKDNPCLPFTIFDLLKIFSSKVLGDFKSGADRYFKLKYIQYEWIRISMENIRRNRGFINGIIYWMWNDCWPASSGWAFIDYYCLPKASYYAFKRCSGDIIASIDMDDTYNIYVCNDTLKNKEALLKTSYWKKGKITPVSEIPVSIAPGTSKKVYSLNENEVPQEALLLCDAVIEGKIVDRAFYKKGPLNIIPTDKVKIVSQSDNTVTVRADDYIHAVELEGDLVFSDNYFSLLPEEEKEISFRPTINSNTTDITLTAYTVDIK